MFNAMLFKLGSKQVGQKYSGIRWKCPEFRGEFSRQGQKRLLAIVCFWGSRMSRNDGADMDARQCEQETFRQGFYLKFRIELRKKGPGHLRLKLRIADVKGVPMNLYTAYTRVYIYNCFGGLFVVCCVDLFQF